MCGHEGKSFGTALVEKQNLSLRIHSLRSWLRNLPDSPYQVLYPSMHNFEDFCMTCQDHLMEL